MSSEWLADRSPNSSHESTERIECRPSGKTTGAFVGDEAWRGLCRSFLRCHRRPLNVTLHLVTTPLGVFGLLAIVHSFYPVATWASALTYLAILWLAVPPRVACVTSITVATLLAAVHLVEPDRLIAFGCLAAGYVGQELAHVLTGEQTLQSTYSGRRGWLVTFIRHTVLLLPALLTIAARRGQSPFRLFVSRKAVMPTKLVTAGRRGDLDRIRHWAHSEQPGLDQSHHWWQAELQGDVGNSFERLSHDDQLMAMIRRFHGSGYEVRPVARMNELYVTGPPKSCTSDTVFYRGHVDGPWAVFPGVRLYRCMVAAGENPEVTTRFPMSGTDYAQPESHRLESGDAVAFDFNRELHYITRVPSERPVESRVNLKLHFVAYPKSLPWYGDLLARMTTAYDIRARRLFLKTIDPDSLNQRLKAKWVLFWTKTFELTVRFVGWTNLAYVLLMSVVAAIGGSLNWFIAATSFVHYAIYIGTLRERDAVSFGTFRRNAVFFKSLALAQLFGLYAMSFSGQWLSLALVLLGFAIATSATLALGFDRTYFSSELGFDSPERVNRFPYGWLPHPMVLGAMTGIAGMLVVPGMRASYGWLIVTHLVAYTFILVQEIKSSSWRSTPVVQR